MNSLSCGVHMLTVLDAIQWRNDGTGQALHRHGSREATRAPAA
jgi:hypothetical protein